jgi:hypothetical protein
MTDFSSYQPPGVQISEQSTTILAPTGVGVTVVAILGPGVGYKSTTDQLQLVGSTLSRVHQLGAIPSSVTITDVSGNLLDPSTYTLTAGAGADGNIAVTADNTLDVSRNGVTIPDGSVVFVSYRYQDAAYYTPSVVEDLDSAVTLYGNPLDPVTGAIVSPLSFAAQIAFQNGARQLVLVATPTPGTGQPTTQADLLAAYAKIATDYSINIVVPIPHLIGDSGIAAVAQDLKAHVVTASNDGYFRVGFFGAGITVTGSPDTQIAAPVSNKRVVVFAPNKLNYYVGSINSSITVGAQYLAAGAAGKIASQRIQDPLTRKQIEGFNGLPATMSNTVKNTLSQGGVTVAEIDRSGRLVIRHGRTTDSTNITTREISMVRARDTMVEMLQIGMDTAAMIGTPIDYQTVVVVKGLVAGILESAIHSGVITGYTNLQARQTVYSNGDPTVIQVKFQYQPVFPLNYIQVSFSVDLSTGTTTLTNLTSSLSGTTSNGSI